jgi:ankyrin repeat protein
LGLQREEKRNPTFIRASWLHFFMCDEYSERQTMQFKSALIVGCALALSACGLLYQSPPTALADAAWRGDVATVRKLVAEGADINELSGAALQLAARGGHPIGPHRCGAEDAGRPAVIAALLDLGANPNQRDGRAPTPGGSSGWTPLFVALHHRQFKTAALLLERGANPTLKSDQGMTVMDMAKVEGAPSALLNLIEMKSLVTHEGMKH